ncbi:MAG TPA: hypothetical protein VMH89_07420, partial [Candidatus Acidoferrum sp.]|nr:hypothetical protein [Candidatus Acidoferrum sp.]
GTLPNDALLLSFFPHMHLRGKKFEYNIVEKDGSLETLLRVNYHFHWQMSYKLADPIALKAGTKLQAVAWFDNSKENPHNPDPDVAVRWGEQTSDEMMVGFFDVAVAPDFDKQRFFQRQTPRNQIATSNRSPALIKSCPNGQVREISANAICRLTNAEWGFRATPTGCAKLRNWSIRCAQNRDYTNTDRATPSHDRTCTTTGSKG